MNVSLESVQFTKMVQELSRMSGKAYKDVLKDQSKVLLEKCVEYTPAASVKRIRKHIKGKNSRGEVGGVAVSVNVKQGAAKNIWMLDESDFGKQNRKNDSPPKMKGGRVALQMKGVDKDGNKRRWSNKRWAKHKAILAAIKARRIDANKVVAARGLAKQSWVQAGKSIGVNVEAPAFVVNARPSSGGGSPKMAESRELSEGGSYAIEIRNYNRILNGKGFDKMKQGRAELKVKFNGNRILERAMKARYTAFKHDLKNGVFDILEDRIKRYPGIFIK